MPANRREQLVKLNPYQKALLRLFRGRKWGYGKGTTSHLNRAAVEGGESIFGLAATLNVFSSYTQLSHDRRIKYADYDAMDEASPEIAQILSLYASEVTAEDYHSKKIIWVESDDQDLVKNLERFMEKLSMDDRVWGLARNLAKYGDCFLLNLFDEGEGGKAILQSVKWIHPTRIDRLEEMSLVGFKCDDLRGIVDPHNDEGIYRPWDFVHGRMMSYDAEDIYGRSMIEEVRKIWKMLQILETMVAISHIQRSMDKHIFYIDTTGLSDEEAMALVKRFKSWLRKKDYFDPTTSQFKSDFNPVTFQEDLFWPTRENDVSKVDTLAGKEVPQSLVDDLNYFRDKLCGGLGVPRDYIDGKTGGGVFDSKAALVLQDVHFARKMVRLQKSLKRMVRWMCEIYLRGQQGENFKRNFEVRMGSLSIVADILNEDRWLKKADVVNQLSGVADVMGWNKQVWSKFIATEVLKDIPRNTLAALLVGGDAPNVGGDSGGEGGDKEKLGKDVTPSKYLPSPKPDSVATRLFSSDDTDPILRSLFHEEKPEQNIKELREDFDRLKKSVVKHYPELENLAKRVEKLAETKEDGLLHKDENE